MAEQVVQVAGKAQALLGHGQPGDLLSRKPEVAAVLGHPAPESHAHRRQEADQGDPAVGGHIGPGDEHDADRCCGGRHHAQPHPAPPEHRREGGGAEDQQVAEGLEANQRQACTDHPQPDSETDGQRRHLACPAPVVLGGPECQVPGHEEGQRRESHHLLRPGVAVQHLVERDEDHEDEVHAREEHPHPLAAPGLAVDDQIGRLVHLLSVTLTPARQEVTALVKAR